MFKYKDLDSYTITTTQPSHFVHIEDIVIPPDYGKTRVGYNKVRWAKEYYKRNGHMDKPISVIAETNERGLPNKLFLVNEYSRLVAALELGLTEVEVIYIDINDYFIQ